MLVSQCGQTAATFLVVAVEVLRIKLDFAARTRLYTRPSHAHETHMRTTPNPDGNQPEPG